MKLKDIENLEEHLKQYKTFIVQENIDKHGKRLIYKVAIYDFFKIRMEKNFLEFWNKETPDNLLIISLETDVEIYENALILHTKDIIGFDIKIDMAC